MMRRTFIAVFALFSMSAAWSAPDLSREVAAAKALMEARKTTEARAVFEQILAQAPDHPEANHSLGLMASDAGEWEKALRCAKIAVASEPNNARFQYGWGAANGIAAMKAGFLSRLGHAKTCLGAYRRAVELEPRNLGFRWALLNYYQQVPRFAGGDREKAFAQAAEIKAIDAESGRRALVQLHLGEKNYDQAFRVYDEALRESPDDYLMRYQFGRLTLLADRRIDEGFAAFRRCLELKPPDSNDTPTWANVHWRLGNCWEKKQQPGQAGAEYREALKLDPDFLPARQALEKLEQRRP